MNTTSEFHPAYRLVRRISDLIRPAALLIVFALFPIAVIQSAVHLVDSMEVERIKQNARILHENILSKIKSADDDPGMLSRSVRRVYQKMNSIESPAAQSRFAKRLIRRYAPALDLYVFDSKGNLRRDLSVGTRPKRAIERCFKTLEDIRAKVVVDSASLGLVSTIINVPADTDTLNESFVLCKLGNRQRDGFFEWGLTQDIQPGRLRGYILLLHPGSFKPNRALMNAIHLVNDRCTSFKVGVADMMNKEVNLFPRDLQG
ncbi:MAG TPA: hypothetical protein PKM25_10185, partial [Candidatus Ozemobacteraceae bacterium]|nr:hypothetical protein [Candidatus Ozemobacteraceae bacterium]